MQQFIRTNDAGTNVFDLDELDIAARANLFEEIDRWAGELDIDLGDGDASNAERAECIDLTAQDAVDTALDFLTDQDGLPVEIDEETKRIVVECMARALATRYAVEL